MNFKVDSSEVVFTGKVFDIKIDQITYNSGNPSLRETVVHPGGAVVVAVKDNGKIILVKQFRYPFQESLYELPAGKLDDGEDPVVAAPRELKEETGFSTAKIRKLGSIYTSPGFCTEELHIYLADELSDGDHSREEGEEDMELFEFTIEELDEMIKSGEIKDSKTISGIYMYKNLTD